MAEMTRMLLFTRVEGQEQISRLIEAAPLATPALCHAAADSRTTSPPLPSHHAHFINFTAARSG